MAWRRKASGWQTFAGVGDGELADLAALRARLARLGDVAASAAVRESVRQLCDGRLTFLGETWPAVTMAPNKPPQFPATFWFHDPITAKSWPDASVSSFDIDVRAAGGDIGDVKYVWEPNCLQMLHPLAAVIAANQERDLHQIGFAVIASWAAANPPYRGVNRKSGIELALRVVSLALFVAAAGPALGAAERAEIRAVIVAHARYLVAFPSLHSSANNHRIAEGLRSVPCGCFVAGFARGARLARRRPSNSLKWRRCVKFSRTALARSSPRPTRHSAWRWWRSPRSLRMILARGFAPMSSSVLFAAPRFFVAERREWLRASHRRRR